MHPFTRGSVLFLPFSLVLLAGPAAAQGSDACSTSQLITGSGPHAFDLNSATTGAEGQSAALCNFFGSTAILDARCANGRLFALPDGDEARLVAEDGP